MNVISKIQTLGDKENQTSQFVPPSNKNNILKRKTENAK